MPYYVIGDDKGFEEAYSADEIDAQMQTVNSAITGANSAVNLLQRNIDSIQNSLNSKQKTISYGTAAPTGGSNGDIYIQY